MNIYAIESLWKRRLAIALVFIPFGLIYYPLKAFLVQYKITLIAAAGCWRRR